MRIGFMGKGGSGKTTISAAFSKWAAQQLSREVLVFDADINAHLQEALCIEGQALPIGQHSEVIAEYLRGTRHDLGDAPLISTTPPAHGSRFLSPTSKDPLLNCFALEKDGVSLVTVGSFEQKDVGANCYHTKLHSLCMILNHLLDSEEDLVVVDCTAGTDSLSTALLLAYDLNIFVVEPTQKSIQVYLDYIATDARSSSKTYYLLNKVVDKGDEAFAFSQLPAENCLGSIWISDALRSFEQGNQDAFARFISSCENGFQSVLGKARTKSRDWSAYMERLCEVHEKNCKWWYNGYYGRNLDQEFDKQFRYESVVASFG
jgi:CO dehydrogenase maturation factor